MGYHPVTRCREYTEGWLGRRRMYTCAECGVKFQVDTLNPLKKEDRVCQICQEKTYVYTFVDTEGKETRVRAGDAELAILRAWQINPRLTIKLS